MASHSLPIAIESKRVIDIDEFVPKKEIDELYLGNPYYIVPDGEVGTQAFAVIREAIKQQGMVASPHPKIYCDTSTLAPNIRDPKSLPELAALKQLRTLHQQGKCTLLRSHIARGELERTKDVALREQLKADYELLEGILKDEKVLGFHTNYDHFGGGISYPLVSDIQDSKIFEEIYAEIKRTVSGAPDFQVRRDAEHLTQAICNECDVFLTRDYKTIIGPMRDWLEHKYAPLRIRLPSELLAEIDQRPDA